MVLIFGLMSVNIGVKRMNNLNNAVQKFLEQLMINQNFMAANENKNLIDEKEYYKLIEPVINLINSKISYEEIKSKLFKQSNLVQHIKEIVESKKLVPGLVVAYGTDRYYEVVVSGYQQEEIFQNDKYVIDKEKMRSNSIFDLSSVSKLFLSIIVLKLEEKKFLSLNDVISSLDSRFKYLSNVTIQDLLSFQVALITDTRISEDLTKSEAENLIFNVKVNKIKTNNNYTDMGSIVLKYVVENVMNKDLYTLCREYIFDLCKMNDTSVEISDKDLCRTVSNNFERRIINNQFIIRTNVEKGKIHDEKAYVLNKDINQMCGHSGIFSTAIDMGNFCQKFIKGELLPFEQCNEIGVNRTGKKIKNGFSQYLGYLCYSKNPNAINSEVNHLLSGNAIGCGGYTGNQLTIDIKNRVFTFLASNRCHNRVTIINPIELKDKYIRRYNNIDYVEWLDNTRYIYTKDYVYSRDIIIDDAVRLSLQYKFLEFLYGQIEDKCKIFNI